MANKVRQEIKKTFSSLIDSAKRENEDSFSDENVQNDATNGSEPLKKATDPKMDNRYFGTTLQSVSQKNKPKRSIVINQSTTVRAMEPKEADDVYLVIDELRAGQAVLVKLNAVDSTIREKIFDHIKGACAYAKFKIEKIDDQMIIIDPSYQED